jgi:hypothetical protein
MWTSVQESLGNVFSLQYVDSIKTEEVYVNLYGFQHHNTANIPIICQNKNHWRNAEISMFINLID